MTPQLLNYWLTFGWLAYACSVRAGIRAKNEGCITNTQITHANRSQTTESQQFIPSLSTQGENLVLRPLNAIGEGVRDHRQNSSTKHQHMNPAAEQTRKKPAAGCSSSGDKDCAHHQNWNTVAWCRNKPYFPINFSPEKNTLRYFPLLLFGVLHKLNRLVSPFSS